MTRKVANIFDIIQKSVITDSISNKNEFLRIFKDLYRAPILKDGLDLIITRAEHGNIKFIIKIPKHWDRLAGCCRTEKRSVFNKFTNTFFHRHSHDITIKQILPEVIIHEIAHALEKESGLDIGEDFRTAIGFDMRDRTPGNMNLAIAVKQIMVEEVKSYPKDHILSELLSRYFEMIALAKEVGGYGKHHFLLSDVNGFFVNATRWIEQIFNANLKPKIADHIAVASAKVIENMDPVPQSQKWSHKVKSFHGADNENDDFHHINNPNIAKTDNKNNIGNSGQNAVGHIKKPPSWTKTTRSNASWYQSYQNHEKIEDGGDK